jgi:hypothetical protein
MKTIIDEAVEAFADRHNDRCLSITLCSCHDLIVRAREYELIIESRIKSEVAGWMNEEKQRWIMGKDKSHLVEWIESVWDNAIKFVEAKK